MQKPPRGTKSPQRLYYGTFLKALLMASSRRLKVGSKTYDIYYLFSNVRRVLSRNSHPLVFLESISKKNRLVQDP